jgi:hypothetical protein
MALRTEHRLKFAEVIIIASALMISIVSLTYTYYQSRKTDAMMQETLQLQKESNDISLGRSREYPSIRAIGLHSFIVPRTDSVWTSEYSVELENRGLIPISGVQVALRGVAGMTYSSGDFRQVYGGEFSELRELIRFNEQLAPGDSVSVKVLTLILRYLRSLDLSLSDGVKYHSMLDIRFLALSSPEDLPIRSPTHEDEVRVTISFLPETLRASEVAAFVETRKPSHHFYTGASPRLQPSGY